MILKLVFFLCVRPLLVRLYEFSISYTQNNKYNNTESGCIIYCCRSIHCCIIHEYSQILVESHTCKCIQCICISSCHFCFGIIHASNYINWIALNCVYTRTRVIRQCRNRLRPCTHSQISFALSIHKSITNWTTRKPGRNA